MKKYLILSAMVALLFLPGCTEEKKEVKTVQWYNEHPKERMEQFEICTNNPGQLKNDPNCINAKQSVLQNSGGSAKRN